MFQGRQGGPGAMSKSLRRGGAKEVIYLHDSQKVKHMEIQSRKTGSE